MIIKDFFLRLLIFFIRKNQSKNLVRFGHNNFGSFENFYKIFVLDFIQHVKLNTNLENFKNTQNIHAHKQAQNAAYIRS